MLIENQVWRRLSDAHHYWLLVVKQNVGNNCPFSTCTRKKGTRAHAGCPRACVCHCRGWGSQVEGTLESSRYRLWLGTVCTLHSKWPPLPYHLWIINVQSVSLSFAIGHSNTVQFSSQTRASLRKPGSSLNLPVPPTSLSASPRSVLWITQEPWSTSVCCYLAGGKMLSWCNCLTSSHYSNISPTQGLQKALGINICVAFKLQYIPAVSCVAFEVFYYPAVNYRALICWSHLVLLF